MGSEGWVDGWMGGWVDGLMDRMNNEDENHTPFVVATSHNHLTELDLFEIFKTNGPR